MFKHSLICFSFLLSVLVTVDARNLHLSEKELRNIGVALKSAITDHVDNNKFEASGRFNLKSNSDDFDVAVDADVFVVGANDEILSGNDVLNGLANGNGNGNGNHNGNVVLQIFNVPVDEDHIIRIPTTESSTSTTDWGNWIPSTTSTDAPLTTTTNADFSQMVKT